MKVLYFDCFSGISGDMTLSALLDLGIDFQWFVNELKKLHVKGWEIQLSEKSEHGITAKHIDVILSEDTEHQHAEHHEHHEHHGLHEHNEHHGHHEHRNMSDIEHIINESGISDGAKDLAKRIFMRLAVAEAKVHHTTPEKVNFHEVGAVDSIIDIVGTAICIDFLSPEKIYASVLHDGYGFVHCQHGIIPVPVPAVTEILTSKGVNFKQLDIESEMMTPTGAAIICELADRFGAMPEMQIVKTGYGAGTKHFSIPNLLRIIQGNTTVLPENDKVTVIETNIDDSTPEILGYVMDKLLESGARDVFFTPVYMKKCRPATMLSVICDAEKVSVMEHIIFTETSTIGIRKYDVKRTILPRKAVIVSTPHGDVKGKAYEYEGTERISIEYEDARRLAQEKNIPIKEVLFNGTSLFPFRDILST
ncbi:MAG: nickel pincer cofactor biosynthesis protein LarC [Tannerella sp.]|jgi:uncharacterized protein (TIGR00299 family) protein|nr:nickel pincer cofactor biosynthesis protein LarC [Tannerella sp.]